MENSVKQNSEKSEKKLGLPFIVWGVMMAILLIIAWVFLKPEQVETPQENQTREFA